MLEEEDDEADWEDGSGNAAIGRDSVSSAVVCCCVLPAVGLCSK